MLKFLWNSTPEEMNTQDNTSKEKKLPSLQANTCKHTITIYTYIPTSLPFRQEKERGSLKVKHVGSNISLVGWLAPNVDLICDGSTLAS